MKLETALQIILDQYVYVSGITGEDIKMDVFNEKNGENIQYHVCVTDYAFNQHGGYDKSKLHVTHEQTVGGEDEGSYYAVILKIDHPEHGTGYVLYQGYYDSWNGTDWYIGPKMAKAVEVTRTEFATIEGEE